MADDTIPSQARDDRGGRPSGGRPAANREPGGFRIRLSDNELRAARAVQEAFSLRSTVAALGFAIRTVAQLLEDGQLDALVAQQQAQGGNRVDNSRGDGSRGDGARGDGSRIERRPGQGEGRGSRPERAARIDPFARPSKPAAPAPEVAVDAVSEGVSEEVSVEVSEEGAEILAATEAPTAEASTADASPDETAAIVSPETTEN